MKRRQTCGTCKKVLTDPKGKPLYILGESTAMLSTMPRTTECLDCGDARRAAEASKKQKNVSRLVQE